MSTLDQDGVEIYYEVTGQGTPLLLTHGFTASTNMWKDNVDALVDAGYQVIAWDMRGHGRSASPDDVALYSAELTVADMNALLDTVGAVRAVIAGMSLGGYMSLAYHLAHRERCQALMLIDTGPGFKKDEAREKWNVYARGRGDDLAKRGDAALSSSSETRLQTQNFQGLKNAAYGMLTQQNAGAINSLPLIKVPTLVVVGDRDEPFIPASDYMASKVPGAQKVVIADAGHASNIDQPKDFNTAVVEFLKSTT